MLSKTILAAILAATSASARRHGVGYFWSAPTVEARMDPIISPGQTSQHVHTVMGGDGFSVSMGDSDAANSKCTGANLAGDKSSYWFPKLYFQDPKTKTFEAVKFGFLKAYYMFEVTDDVIEPFPDGFRMVVGNPFQRKDIYQYPFTGVAQVNGDDNTPEIQPISWSCERQDGKLTYNQVTPHGTHTGTEGPGLTKFVCDKNFGSYIHFPSCADLSQPFTNYANNTVWPNKAANGKQNCPAGYTHLPHLFLEIHWDEQPFRGRWTEGVDQPFVLANGDQTGYGGHADFIAGWDQTTLKTLIKSCGTASEGVANKGDGLDSCPDMSIAPHPQTCTVPPHITEDVQGPFAALPGCNPIQNGPQDAVMCDCSSGKPVCDGKVTSPSGSGSGSGSGTSNGGDQAPPPPKASSSAGGQVSAPTGGATAPSSTLATVTKSVTPVNTGMPAKQPAKPSSQPENPSTQPGNGTPPSGGDNGENDDGQDEDDNTCDVPAYTSVVTIQPTVTVTHATPAPMVRRALGHALAHRNVHKHA